MTMEGREGLGLRIERRETLVGTRTNVIMGMSMDMSMEMAMGKGTVVVTVLPMQAEPIKGGLERTGRDKTVGMRMRKCRRYEMRDEGSYIHRMYNRVRLNAILFEEKMKCHLHP
jgi:hypothetical protein